MSTKPPSPNTPPSRPGQFRRDSANVNPRPKYDPPPIPPAPPPAPKSDG
jgi:hypothetical protein